MQFLPSPIYAASIRRLTETLLACPIGSIVTFTQLSNALQTPIEERRYLLITALKRANAESGAIFQNKYRVGYERLPASSAHVVGKRARVRGRRLHHRASIAITNTLAKANDLTEWDRQMAYREQAALGLLQHMGRNRNLPLIQEGVPPPPLHQTVRDSVKMLREHLTSVYG